MWKSVTQKLLSLKQHLLKQINLIKTFLTFKFFCKNFWMAFLRLRIWTLGLPNFKCVRRNNSRQKFDYPLTLRRESKTWRPFSVSDRNYNSVVVCVLFSFTTIRTWALISLWRQLVAAAPEFSDPLDDKPVSQPAVFQTLVGYSVVVCHCTVL